MSSSPDSMDMIVDVGGMFFSGLSLLLFYTTFAARDRKLFIVSLSIYFGLINLYSLLYINQISELKLRSSVHHRWLVYIYMYNMLLSIFLVVLSLIQS